jgi:hypothetical protein
LVLVCASAAPVVAANTAAAMIVTLFLIVNLLL